VSVDTLAYFRGSKIRRIVLLHVVVAVSFLIWRAIENTPATSAAQASTFVVTPVGRGLALALVLASAAASIAIVITTCFARREAVAWLLFAVWIAALVQREHVDVFDIVYVLITTIAAAAAFSSRRN
jgi:hypothetical protein